MENFDFYFEKLIEISVDHIPKLILAVITLFVGLWLIKFISKGLTNLMESRDLDKSLRIFLGRFISVVLKVLLAVIVVSMVGVETTSIIAMLGAASLAVGLALQGSLANFAGGVLILILKPFRVDDFIEAAGHSGTVQEISIFYTIIKTPQNQVITIPNAQVSNNSVVNFSMEDTRRVDLVFGIGYGDDIDHAKTVLKKVIESDTRIFSEPLPAVDVEALADSSVNFKVKLWVNRTDYWDVYYYMQENVKKEFDKEKISIPFPQRDVHIHQS